jgi:hypothetical protein
MVLTVLLALQILPNHSSPYVSGNNSEPIKDATVLIRNESTGFKTNSLSNFKGVFTFKELPL